MTSRRITLPKCISKLTEARDLVRSHYRSTGLRFTLDGRLVGDVGEAAVAEAFDLVLCAERIKGVDAHTRAGKSVQIKATGQNKGPAFSRGDTPADYLVFVRIDFETCTAEVIYNGPEAPVRALVPKGLKDTKRVSLKQVVALDAAVSSAMRLPFNVKR